MLNKKPEVYIADFYDYCNDRNLDANDTKSIDEYVNDYCRWHVMFSGIGTVQVEATELRDILENKEKYKDLIDESKKVTESNNSDIEEAIRKGVTSYGISDVSIDDNNNIIKFKVFKDEYRVTATADFINKVEEIAINNGRNIDIIGEGEGADGGDTFELEFFEDKNVEKLQESHLDDYSADKKYKVTYIDGDGKDKEIDYTPSKNTNIAGVQKELGNKYKDFFKLKDIKTESKKIEETVKSTSLENSISNKIIDTSEKLDDNDKHRYLQNIQDTIDGIAENHDIDIEKGLYDVEKFYNEKHSITEGVDLTSLKKAQKVVTNVLNNLEGNYTMDDINIKSDKEGNLHLFAKNTGEEIYTVTKEELRKGLKEGISKMNKELTQAEKILQDIIQSVNSNYTLDDVVCETTSEGNIHIMTKDGKDICTIDREKFAINGDDTELIDQLRENGYWKNDLKESKLTEDFSLSTQNVIEAIDREIDKMSKEEAEEFIENLKGILNGYELDECYDVTNNDDVLEESNNKDYLDDEELIEMEELEEKFLGASDKVYADSKEKGLYTENTDK